MYWSRTVVLIMKINVKLHVVGSWRKLGSGAILKLVSSQVAQYDKSKKEQVVYQDNCA